MRFFRKQKKSGSSDTISIRIATYLQLRQRKLADWLNQKAAKASRQDLLFGLVVFCSLFGGYLLFLLLETFGAFN